jgi:hypothetical protein
VEFFLHPAKHFSHRLCTAIGYHRGNGETNIARATRRANRRPNDLINAVTSTTRTQ